MWHYPPPKKKKKNSFDVSSSKHPSKLAASDFLLVFLPGVDQIVVLSWCSQRFCRDGHGVSPICCLLDVWSLSPPLNLLLKKMIQESSTYSSIVFFNTNSPHWLLGTCSLTLTLTVVQGCSLTRENCPAFYRSLLKHDYLGILYHSVDFSASWNKPLDMNFNRQAK